MANYYTEKGVYFVQKNSKDLELLALFNALKEDDQQIVILLAESLAERRKNNTPTIASNIAEGKSDKNRIVYGET